MLTASTSPSFRVDADVDVVGQGFVLHVGLSLIEWKNTNVSKTLTVVDVDSGGHRMYSVCSLYLHVHHHHLLDFGSG